MNKSFPSPGLSLAGLRRAALLCLGAGLLAACQPSVALRTPEPITINLNVNITHEMRLKVEEDVEEAFNENDKIF